MAAGCYGCWTDINVSRPFRAYVADTLPEEQRGMGFSIQSFFIARRRGGRGHVTLTCSTSWFGVSDAADGSNALPPM